MITKDIVMEYSQDHDIHNAEQSLREELVAIALYEKRIGETRDPKLAQILIHNRDEEKKHAHLLRLWLSQKKRA